MTQRQIKEIESIKNNWGKIVEQKETTVQINQRSYSSVWVKLEDGREYVINHQGGYDGISNRLTNHPVSW